MAVLLTEFNRATGDWILISAARVNKHRRGTGMLFFEFPLGETRIVAAPRREAECGRMAGVSEQNRGKRSVGSGHCHDRHRVIDGSHEGNSPFDHGRNIGLAVVAAIDSERGTAFTLIQLYRRQTGNCIADHIDKFLHHTRRVFLNELNLVAIDGVIIDQIAAQSGTAVIMRESEHHLMSVEVKLLFDLRECHIAHVFGDALKVAGDENDSAAVRIFEGESFHPEIMQFPVRGSFRAVPCQPDSFFGSDYGFRDPGLPQQRRFVGEGKGVAAKEDQQGEEVKIAEERRSRTSAFLLSTGITLRRHLIRLRLRVWRLSCGPLA